MAIVLFVLWNLAKDKSKIIAGRRGKRQSEFPHFFDQAEMYSKGQFKDVLFYKEDVMKHAERTIIRGAMGNRQL